MQIMLRRVISLTIVLTGLLLAGGPPWACAAVSDCCPSGPGGPCKAPDGLATQTAVGCCAAGTAMPAIAASMSLPSERAVRQNAGTPPAAIDSVVLDRTTGWRRSASSIGGEVRAYRVSGSVLYLSTGRLRL